MKHRYFYGIGYRIVKSVTTNKKEYFLWQNMLRRCYDPKHVRYKNYGGNGVFVCNRWHCFDYFIEDLPKIKGWDEQLFKNGKLQLDKDYLQKHKKIKSYSLKGCIWLSQKENSLYQPNQMKEFIAISPTGIEYEAVNKNQFCKKHNLCPSNVSMVLNKHRKTHKKWRFYYKDAPDSSGVLNSIEI